MILTPCVTDIVVVGLFFLSPGRHARSDIPEMLEEIATRYPQIKSVVTEPLGVDQRIAELLLVRAEEAMESLRS